MFQFPDLICHTKQTTNKIKNIKIYNYIIHLLILILNCQSVKEIEEY